MPLPLLKRWPPLLRHTGGDFEVSRRDKGPLQKLLILSLSDDAQSTVFVERPEASKTHLATALGISGLTRHGKRVRFYFTVELVKWLQDNLPRSSHGNH